MEFKRRDSRPINVAWWNSDAKAYVKTFNPLETFVFGDLVREYADESAPNEKRIAAAVRATIMSLVDENGEQLLNEGDIPALLEGPGFMIDRVVLMATNRNRVDVSLKKNSGGRKLRVPLAAGLDASATGFGDSAVAGVGNRRLENGFRSFRRTRLAPRRLPGRAALLLEERRTRNARRLSSLSARR